MLLGELVPESGSVRKGTNVQIGYLAQEETFLKHKKEKLIVAVCQILDIVKNDEEEGRVRMTLKRFGFGEEDVQKEIQQLSAGEQSRLRLALMQLMRPNCIILDEPTNHLDIAGLEALEEALLEFGGTLIVVSHDPVFVKKIKLGKVVKLS